MKALRCIRCSKALLRFAVEIPDGKGGVVGWGPTCARYVTVTPTRRLDGRPRVESRARVQERDPRQMELECFA